MMVPREERNAKKRDPVYPPQEIIKMRREKGLSKEEGLDMLRKYVQRKFPNPTIVSMIDDLCRAKDVRLDPEGNIYETPNWLARHRGLQEVLKFMSINNDIDKPERTPVNIQFNVIGGKTLKVKADHDNESHGETIQLDPG